MYGFNSYAEISYAELVSTGVTPPPVVTTTDTHDGFKHDGTFKKDKHKRRTYEASTEKQSIRKQVEKLFYGEPVIAPITGTKTEPLIVPKEILPLPYDPLPNKLYGLELQYHELLAKRRQEALQLAEEQAIDDEEATILLLN